MDPEKIKAVTEWPVPRNLRDVQAFLGFCNFYRRFITGYSTVARPLTALTSSSMKDATYPWKPDSDCNLAFEQLKSLFTTAGFLAHFDPSKDTWMETDASDYVTAAVLSQFVKSLIGEANLFQHSGSAYVNELALSRNFQRHSTLRPTAKQKSSMPH